MEEDFSPVVESGELVQPRGIRGWLLGGDAPPAEDDRHAVVLVRANGERVRAGDRTAGERACSDARRWVKVDLTAHPLSYDVPLQDPSGRVGLVATVAVTCRVDDPPRAAGAEGAGVRELMRQPLTQAAIAAYGVPDAATGADPMAVLNATRAEAQLRLDQLVGRAIPGLDWLSMTVTAVTVAFDATTRRHFEDLLSHAREEDLIASKTRTRVAEMKGEEAVGTARREAFAGRLNSEWDILLEATIADPSPERLERFAARLREFRRDDLNAAMTAYRFAVENGLEANELLNHVRQLLPGANAANAPAPEALEASPRAEQIESETGGDRDWSRRPQ